MTFQEIWLASMVVLILGCFFFMFRTHWVHEARMSVLIQKNTSLALYQYYRLPSFNYMITRFWIWDIETFKRVEK